MYRILKEIRTSQVHTRCWIIFLAVQDHLNFFKMLFSSFGLKTKLNGQDQDQWWSFTRGGGGGGQDSENGPPCATQRDTRHKSRQPCYAQPILAKLIPDCKHSFLHCCTWTSRLHLFSRLCPIFSRRLASNNDTQ